MEFVVIAIGNLSPDKIDEHKLYEGAVQSATICLPEAIVFVFVKTHGVYERVKLLDAVLRSRGAGISLDAHIKELEHLRAPTFCTQPVRFVVKSNTIPKDSDVVGRKVSVAPFLFHESTVDRMTELVSDMPNVMFVTIVERPGYCLFIHYGTNPAEYKNVCETFMARFIRDIEVNMPP